MNHVYGLWPLALLAAGIRVKITAPRRRKRRKKK